ncbi:porin family protein [Nonlabens ponticola]|nr:porin family protein [Nonlabens ponticola]
MKTTITTLLLLLAGVTLNAQANDKGDITIAPLLGVAFSTYSSSEDVSFDARTAIAAGATVDFYLSDRWSLRSGLSYAPYGAEDDFGNVDKINYLKIPLNANWHFGGKRNWYLNFGFSANVLLNAKGELEDGQEIDLEDFIEPFDLGLDLGIGYKFYISEDVQFYGEYQGYTGFLNLLDVGPDVDVELRNAASIFNVGVILKL